MATAKDLHSNFYLFNKYPIYFQESHQIWLNYLSPSLSYGQKTLRVVPNTPPGRIGLSHVINRNGGKDGSYKEYINRDCIKS